MKRCLLFSLLILAACSDSKKNVDDKKGLSALVNNPYSANGMDTVAAAQKPTMDFKDTLHSFGMIHEDEIVQYEFAFTNNGKTPLVISSAAGSCGCTVPDYPRDPVQPGKSAVIKVTFNSANKSGHQEKSVTISANTLRNTHKLYIQAEIAKK